MLRELVPGAPVDYREYLLSHGLELITEPDPVSIAPPGLVKALYHMSAMQRFYNHLIRPGPRGLPRVIAELGIGRGYGTAAMIAGYRDKNIPVHTIGIDNGSSDEYMDELGIFRPWAPDKLVIGTLSHFGYSFIPGEGTQPALFARGTTRQFLDFAEGTEGTVHDLFACDPPENGFAETGHRAQQYGNKHFILHAGRVLQPGGRLMTLGTGETQLEKLMARPYQEILEVFEKPKIIRGFYRKYDLPDNQLCSDLIMRLIDETLKGETRLRQEDIAALMQRVQSVLPESDVRKTKASIQRIIQKVEESSQAFIVFKQILNQEFAPKELYTKLIILKKRNSFKNPSNVR